MEERARGVVVEGLGVFLQSQKAERRDGACRREAEEVAPAGLWGRRVDKPGVEEGELRVWGGESGRRERREVREEVGKVERSEIGRHSKKKKTPHNRDRHQRRQHSDPLLVLLDDALRSLLRHREGKERV